MTMRNIAGFIRLTSLIIALIAANHVASASHEKIKEKRKQWLKQLKDNRERRAQLPRHSDSVITIYEKMKELQSKTSLEDTLDLIEGEMILSVSGEQEDESSHRRLSEAREKLTKNKQHFLDRCLDLLDHRKYDRETRISELSNMMNNHLLARLRTLHTQENHRNLSWDGSGIGLSIISIVSAIVQLIVLVFVVIIEALRGLFLILLDVLNDFYRIIFGQGHCEEPEGNHGLLNVLKNEYHIFGNKNKDEDCHSCDYKEKDKDKEKNKDKSKDKYEDRDRDYGTDYYAGETTDIVINIVGIEETYGNDDGDDKKKDKDKNKNKGGKGRRGLLDTHRSREEMEKMLPMVSEALNMDEFLTNGVNVISQNDISLNKDPATIAESHDDMVFILSPEQEVLESTLLFSLFGYIISDGDVMSAVQYGMSAYAFYNYDGDF